MSAELLSGNNFRPFVSLLPASRFASKLRKFPFFTGFLAALAICSGCSRFAEPADLVIINGPEPESLDPAMITGQADGRIVLSLFEGLTRFNAVTATPEPGLAKSWDISEDGRGYTFHLRTNAVWSTGEPITADDVVYSWRRVLDPGTASEYSGLLFYIKNAKAFGTGKTDDPASVGIAAAGPHAVRVELNQPTIFFLDICALPNFCIVPRHAIEKRGDRWLMQPPVPTSGAYTLDAWRLNDRIRLRKNPNYWDAENTHSEVVDLLPCGNGSTALNLYESGTADIVWDKELVPSELIDLLIKRPDFHSFDYLGTYFIRFNVTRVPFDDVRVRKALSMAIDKEQIVAKITKAGEKAAHHFVPPILPNYTSPPGLEHDPETARRLMTEAGFPGGRGFPPFDYLFNNTGKSHEQIAVELQAMWKRELGILVNLRKLEWKVYLRAQSMLEYDTCRSSWIGDYNDANTFLDMFLSNSGNNRTGWKNPQFDELLEKANGEADLNRRETLLQAAESLLIHDDVPIVPLYIYSGLEYYDRSKIRGVYPNSRSEHPLRAIHRIVPKP
ncbi:MAG: peptide ABC transporter substrate-binding protein [Verrucomicrobia bacterium]|nr:peptide ABC transporter substrate-binding protein [Verrucomicrobiota bacterium]